MGAYFSSFKSKPQIEIIIKISSDQILEISDDWISVKVNDQVIKYKYGRGIDPNKIRSELKTIDTDLRFGWLTINHINHIMSLGKGCGDGWITIVSSDDLSPTSYGLALDIDPRYQDYYL